MPALENEAAIRRAVAHLSRTCSSHGHYKDLYAALETANPELARLHAQSLGGDAEAAGIALGLRIDGSSSAPTVLDAYLFGDSSATLGMISELSKVLSKIPPGFLSECSPAAIARARRRVRAKGRAQ